MLRTLTHHQYTREQLIEFNSLHKMKIVCTVNSNLNIIWIKICVLQIKIV